MNKQYVCLKEPETQESLLRWWYLLNERRGDRARLRRAEGPDDVLLSEPFFHFLQQMPEEWASPKPYRLQTSALVAAALSHVKQHQEGKHFAAQLAAPKGEKAKMSELRFEQLQKSRSPEEFLRRLRRAICLLDGKADVLYLADGILLWMNEYRDGVDRKPANRFAVRWAVEYYKALANLSKNKEE